MRSERVSSLELLLPEWEALWQRCPAATPFQSPAWLLRWWETLGSGELFSLAIRDNGRLIALAPMFLHSWEGRRQVTFIGNGVSDHLDILAECGSADRACTLLLQDLAGQCDRWDLCDLQDLCAASPLLTSKPPSPVKSEIRPQYTCSLIPLPGTVARFHEGLPHGLRRNLRRYRTQLEAQGDLSFGTAGEADFDQYFEALFRLHRARWHDKNDPGMLESRGLERFHIAAARHLQRQGLVRLHALRLNNRIVAVVYAFVHRQRAYSYLGGFDPQLARFSPGALILAYTIEQAILEGVREFDFLRGAEAYKSDWGAKTQASSRLMLWHS